MNNFNNQFEDQDEYIHSWYLLIIAMLIILLLFVSKLYYLNFFLVAGVTFLFLKNKLPLTSLIKIIKHAFLFSITIFLFATLNPSNELKQGEVFIILGKKFYELSLLQGLKTSYKIFLLSFISMGSASTINYTKVILYLIVNKGLKLIWGYPILLAMNSMILLKDELERIKINARFRQLPFFDRIFIFFPLLVFAIRHSERGAMSLLTRGLSERKTFFNKYDVSLRDQMFFYSFLFVYVLLIIFIIIRNRL